MTFKSQWLQPFSEHRNTSSSKQRKPMVLQEFYPPGGIFLPQDWFFSLSLPLSICLSHPFALPHPLNPSLSLSYPPIYSAFPQSISLCLFCYHLSLLPLLHLSRWLLHISVSRIKMPHLDLSSYTAADVASVKTKRASHQHCEDQSACPFFPLFSSVKRLTDYPSLPLKNVCLSC